MPEPQIPDSVARLLDTLDSVFELELLLLLRDLPDHDWSAPAVSRMFNLEPEPTRLALLGLARKGLVERRYGGQSVCFRLAEDTPRASAADQLASLYAQHRPRIVAYLTATLASDG